MGDAPESHKVKVAAAEARAAADKATTEAAQVERRTARRGMYKRAAQYQAEYASIDKSLIRQRRQAKAAGNYFCEPEAKLMFVIRIRGMCDMHPKTKKILQLLNLRQVHLGVFLCDNKGLLDSRCQLPASLRGLGFAGTSSFRKGKQRKVPRVTKLKFGLRLI